MNSAHQRAQYWRTREKKQAPQWTTRPSVTHLTNPPLLHVPQDIIEVSHAEPDVRKREPLVVPVNSTLRLAGLNLEGIEPVRHDPELSIDRAVRSPGQHWRRYNRSGVSLTRRPFD